MNNKEIKKKFIIETMEPRSYPVGSIHFFTDLINNELIEMECEVVDHKAPLPAINWASFPRVVFEVKSTKKVKQIEKGELLSNKMVY